MEDARVLPGMRAPEAAAEGDVPGTLVEGRVARHMRLLAVDPGSSQIGFAYFEDEASEPQTAIMRAPAGPDASPGSWLERVTWIGERIRDRSVSLAPAVSRRTAVLGRGEAEPDPLNDAMTRVYLIAVSRRVPGSSPIRDPSGKAQLGCRPCTLIAAAPGRRSRRAGPEDAEDADARRSFRGVC